MKPGHVKVVVVVAATAVEGADVREGEAVTGVEVVAEDATNSTEDSGDSAFCQLSCHCQQQLSVRFIGTTEQ